MDTLPFLYKFHECLLLLNHFYRFSILHNNINTRFQFVALDTNNVIDTIRKVVPIVSIWLIPVDMFLHFITKGSAVKLFPLTSDKIMLENMTSPPS